MATITRTTTFVDNTVLTAAQLNNEFNNALNALALVNADISGSAAIVESKLLFSGTGHGHTGTTDGKTIATAALAANAVTNANIAQATGLSQSITTVDPTTTDITGATITFTTTGGPCLVIMHCTFTNSTVNIYSIVYIILDGVTTQYAQQTAVTTTTPDTATAVYLSTPAAGSHTWKLGGAVQSASTVSVKAYSIAVIELKK